MSPSRKDASYVHCDVTNEDDVRSAAETAVAKYGRIDVMFCNAGLISKSTPLAEFWVSDFRMAMDVNLTGCFLAANHAARVMIPRRKGGIILTESVTSAIGGIGKHAYTASKHVVVGLTRSLAAEPGQFGIRANCISSYLVETPLSSGALGLSGAALEEASQGHSILKGITLEAEDIAEAALYLASEESKFTGGLNLVADGGFTVVDGEINIFKGLY